MRRGALAAATLRNRLGLSLACGGGGGSGGGGEAEITPDSADEIASGVLHAIDMSAELSVVGAGFAAAVIPDAASAASSDGDRFRGLDAAILALQEGAGDGPPSLPGGTGISAASQAIGPITLQCAGGGTKTVSGTITNVNAPTAGDHLNGRFTNCVELDEMQQPLPELDGRLDFTILSIFGDLNDLFALGLDLTFDGFTIDNELEMNGRAAVSTNNTSPPLLNSSAQGERLSFEQDPDSLTLSRFATLLTQDDGDDAYDIVSNGFVTSSSFDGEVEYDVTETLGGDTGEPPSDGVVLVESGSSAMRIVPLDATNVDLELDLDGDGTFSAADTIHTTWAALGF